MSYPILDILTDDEIHEALVTKTLARHQIDLPAAEVNAHVVHRNVRQGDGTWQMISSVAVLGPKKKDKNATVPPPAADSGPKING